MDVKLVKLKCGDEFLGEVSEFGGFIKVKNPVSLAPTEEGLRFVPYPMLAKQPINLTIQEEDFVYVLEVIDNIANVYRSQFGGIVEPPKSSLIV